MTLAKKFEENRLTIIGTATLLLLLGAGFQSGIFSSRESMEQFLRQTGVLAPLCFLLARHYGQAFLLKFVPEETFQKYISRAEKGKKFDVFFLLALILPGMPDDLLCLIAGLTSMSLKKYLVFTLLGRPFSLLAYSLGGALILENLTALF